MAVKARQIRPGEGFAVEVKMDELVQIVAVSGKQVAQFVAFNAEDHGDQLSTAVTRAKAKTIMLQKGKRLFSSHGNELFELTEDTVGRHDLFYPIADEKTPNPTEGLDPLPSSREALAESLAALAINPDPLPDPINFFMRVSILQKGELEIQETLSERNDYVVLRALTDAVIAVAGGSAEQNGGDAKNSDLLVRVFR